MMSSVRVYQFLVIFNGRKQVYKHISSSRYDSKVFYFLKMLKSNFENIGFLTFNSLYAGSNDILEYGKYVWR